MCTGITYKNGEFYFGRTLDLEYSFGEQVVITPRNYSLSFTEEKTQNTHYGMIGMANAREGYPLYAEAVNEKGLCMAGLNFPGNAYYQKSQKGKNNVASFEIIPWVLGKCANIQEVKEKLKEINITDTAFSTSMQPVPLHWMIADKEGCLVLEATKKGVQIYENPFGVLTNNPPFEYHRSNVCNYLNLTSAYPQNHFTKEVDILPYSQGMGSIGLPGDMSSASRFIRAAFMKFNSKCDKKEAADVAQVFHILDNVSMVRGTVITEDGKYDFTRYSCCMNPKRGCYYYKTYENSHIQVVKMDEKNLDSSCLLSYDISTSCFPL